MRIVFLGTPEFGIKPLRALIEAGHDIAGVVTQPDKPQGRKMILTPPPLKVYAESLGLKVFQFEKISAPQNVQTLKELKPDIMITAAYGQILSKDVLNVAPYGVINIHASLLPKYRGASPVQAALLNGEKVTGVTIMQTNEGLDTGDIILAKPVDIEPGDDCGTLTEKLSDIGALAVSKALELIGSGKATHTPQDNSAASYCRVIKKEQTFIDWKSETAQDIFNKVRAFSPKPLARANYCGTQYLIKKVAVFGGGIDNNCQPGEIIVNDNKLLVCCREGFVEVLELQPAGKKMMSASQYLCGYKINPGAKFE